MKRLFHGTELAYHSADNTNLVTVEQAVEVVDGQLVGGR